MMKITTQRILTPAENDKLTRWLTNTLQNEKLENPASLNVSNLVLFVDDKARLVEPGLWEFSEYTNSVVVLAHSSGYEVPTLTRLTTLCGLAQYCDDNAELRAAMSSAITRYLLGEYQALSSNLVNAVSTPQGIAFSTDNRVASLFESGWMLPSGESVDVSGEEWTVCATQVPATESVTPVVVTEPDIEF